MVSSESHTLVSAGSIPASAPNDLSFNGRTDAFEASSLGSNPSGSSNTTVV